MITRTTCCIAGGGPAGMMLGLLLARAGVEVCVLEKHADFLRDFRGDTIHPSTLEVLDEIGLSEEFLALPQHQASVINFMADNGTFPLADLRETTLRYPFIAFVPQWDFLDLLAGAGRTLPSFRLLMRAEVTGLLRRDGRVTGVRYADADGGTHELEAALTVAADGRNSVLRDQAGLPLQRLGAPMDVLWFRLPRHPDDPASPFLRISGGRAIVALNRGAYWQLAFLIRKGGHDQVRRQGIEAVRRPVGELLPLLRDRIGELTDLDDVHMLEVRVDRLRRWHRPGLLLIGDAAHAMSPVAGVGINLAVQDAVAAANLLTTALLAGTVTEGDLARVQKRRWRPTVATQAMQRIVQSTVIRPGLRGRSTIPLPIRLALRFPAVRRRIAWFVGAGFRPEHVATPDRADSR